MKRKLIWITNETRFLPCMPQAERYLENHPYLFLKSSLVNAMGVHSCFIIQVYLQKYQCKYLWLSCLPFAILIELKSSKAWNISWHCSLKSSKIIIFCLVIPHVKTFQHFTLNMPKVVDTNLHQAFLLPAKSVPHPSCLFFSCPFTSPHPIYSKHATLSSLVLFLWIATDGKVKRVFNYSEMKCG